MILINDGVGLINPKLDYKKYKNRSIRLSKIVNNEMTTQERREEAADELLDCIEYLRELDELIKTPFDVLVIVQR